MAKETIKELKTEIADLREELELEKEKNKKILQPIINAILEDDEFNLSIKTKMEDIISCLSITY